MRPLNNKIKFELLPEDEQPKKTSMVPFGDALKKVKVLEVGTKVEDIEKDDILVLYNHDVMLFEGSMGYCLDRDPVFINDHPQKNKTHIQPKKADRLSKFEKGTVLSTTDPEMSKGDEIGFKKANGLILPDNTEIISDTQIYFKS